MIAMFSHQRRNLVEILIRNKIYEIYVLNLTTTSTGDHFLEKALLFIFKNSHFSYEREKEPTHNHLQTPSTVEG